MQRGFWIFLLIFSTQTAFAETYQCSVSNRGNRGFVQQDMVFAIDRAAGKVFVADELILTLNDKQPMLATVKELTDNRVELRWMVKDVPTSSMAIGVSNAGKIDVNFRGRLLLNTMRVQVRASIKGNETGGGDGTCHLIRQ